MGYMDAHKVLMEIWETTVHGYFDILEAAMGIDHSKDITSKEEASALKEGFKERYGRDGDRLLGTLITSPAFNGDNDPEAEKKLYPGMAYSIPLSFYFVRRALEEETPERAYEVFVNDIKAYAKESGMNTERIPPQDFIEELTEPKLQELEALNITLNGHGASSQDQSDDHDNASDTAPS